MHDGFHVRVVVVEPVHQRAVHQYRIAHAEPRRHADHRAIPRLANRLDARKDPFGERIAGRRHGDADRIEDQIFGALPDIRRNIVIA